MCTRMYLRQSPFLRRQERELKKGCVKDNCYPFQSRKGKQHFQKLDMQWLAGLTIQGASEQEGGKAN